MGKKLPNTPRSRVRAALRQLWLRSRERAAALKREGNTCQICKRKASKAKGKEFSVEVHHIDGICNWDKLIDLVFEQLLCDPSLLEVLCKECHEKEHENG
jgi:predicted HNH restriction endonuclease